MKKILDYSVSDLMSGLRSVMQKEMSASRRLSAILTLLCEQLHMPSAVFYMMRPGEVLERYMMVGQSGQLPCFVRLGEAVAGEVALSKKLRIVYAKTGFNKTVFAVPVLRGSEVVAVLEMRSDKVQSLPNEVIEAVENVAMILAEFLPELKVGKTSEKLGNISPSTQIEGIPLVRGFALGSVLIHRRFEVTGSILTDNPNREIKALNGAFSRVQRLLKKRLNRTGLPIEEKELFDGYLMFLNDVVWKGKVLSSIQSGLTAQVALQKVAEEMMDKMRSSGDVYWRERAKDFQDLTVRLMQSLEQKSTRKKIVGNKILVADTLGASELLDYDLKHIKGIVLEDASQTTHVVIVARAYRIPLIGGVKDVAKMFSDSAPVAMDAVRGVIYLHPTDEVLETLRVQKQHLLRLARMEARHRDKPAFTKDGERICLMLNLGLSAGLDKLPSCDGVGLYRTELLFMTAKSFPDIKAQTEAYKRVLALAKGLPVVFRTLDIGSDKVLPYLTQQTEENPAMGWRSIRMVLDRRALLRNQLRALVRATAGDVLRVMFPMVTDVSEFLEAKRTLDIEVKNAMARKEKVPKEIMIGTMLEVPSLIFQLEKLLPYVDFVSVGTNDLAQFMFAADRTNALLSNRYDVLSPAFLKMLKYVADMCTAFNVKCSVCGEMASRPVDALTLVALGYRVLSMSPEALGGVKMAISSLELARFEKYLYSRLDSAQSSLREDLYAYLRDHHVQLGDLQ